MTKRTGAHQQFDTGTLLQLAESQAHLDNCATVAQVPALALRYLKALGKLDRPAGLSLWRTQCMWRQRQENFYPCVIKVLIECGLVTVSHSVRYAVTPAGRAVLGLPLVNAKATTMAPLRPRQAMLVREGSMDYAAIPSRIGSKQIPFKSSLASACLTGGNVR